MSRLGLFFLSCFWVGFSPHGALGAAAKEPDFKEVYSLIESNLPAGVSRAELNGLALKSLITGLDSRVSIVSGTNQAATVGSAVSKAEMFERTMAYIRVAAVEADLAKAVAGAFKQLGISNKIQGVVLDLRYCAGTDYAAAAAVADLFVTDAKPLLDWGDGMVSSKEAGAIIGVPAAVLVNESTAGAAEALAGVLREAGAGLVLGSRTAGLAAVGQEFPLASGQQLRIKVRPVKLGNGATLGPNGVVPDITVDVAREEERSYYADAFAVIPRSNSLAGVPGPTNGIAGTNRTARRMRFNEADLVREHGEGRVEGTRRVEVELDGQIVHDPALARALDVLKGLAVVRRKSP